MMDKRTYARHLLTESFASPDEAKEKWESLVANSWLKDFKGPNASVRIGINVLKPTSAGLLSQPKPKVKGKGKGRSRSRSRSRSRDGGNGG